MNKKLSLLLLTSFLMLMPFCNAAGDTLSRPKGSISISINDSEYAKPDECVISLSINTLDKDAKKAAEINKQTTLNVLKALKAKMNTQRGDKLETRNYSIVPNYRYDRDKKFLEGYSVKNEVSLDLKTTENIGDYIDVAIKNGANRLNGVEFRLDKYQKYCDSLIKSSTKTAYNQAAIVAQSMNTTVEGIKDISISCSPQNQRMSIMPKFMANGLLGSSNAESSTPIESGDIIININLNASFYVK